MSRPVNRIECRDIDSEEAVVFMLNDDDGKWHMRRYLRWNSPANRHFVSDVKVSQEFEAMLNTLVRAVAGEDDSSDAARKRRYIEKRSLTQTDDVASGRTRSSSQDVVEEQLVDLFRPKTKKWPR